MRRSTDSARKVCVAARLLLKDLMRRRITLLLLFVVPALFDAVVIATTARRESPVAIGSLVKKGVLLTGTRTLDQRTLSLVFLATAAVGFLACFLGFNLVHQRREADARLVLAGYRVREVLGAKLLTLVVLVATLAVYEASAIRPWVAPHQNAGLVLGLFLAGLVYGCLGFLVGAVAKDELEGIFAIVLLTNVDLGWLQNPIYYATSERRSLIEALPGYGPTQTVVVGTFTDDIAQGAVLRSLAWLGFALLASFGALGLRIRPRPSGPASARGRYAKLMLVSYLAWIALFQVVGRCAARLHTVDLTSHWDRALPLVPSWVWAYETCYLVPLLAIVIIHDWHRFNIGLLAVLLANLGAFVVYLALPVAFPRPELGSSLAERVLALEYASDFSPGANKLPSMHVAMAWIMTLAMLRQRRRWVDAALIALTIAITISTVLVKQHIILDAATGVAWGLAAHWLGKRLYHRVTDANAAPDDALAQLLDFSRWRRLVERRQ